MTVKKDKAKSGKRILALAIAAILLMPGVTAFAAPSLKADLADASGTTIQRARVEEVLDTYKEFTGFMTTGTVKGVRYDYAYKRLSFPNSYSYKGVEIVDQYAIQGDKVNGVPAWGTVSVCKCQYKIW